METTTQAIKEKNKILIEVMGLKKWRSELQINQDIAFQRRAWRVQRIAWTIMALFMLAGLMGLLGRPGLLSQARITTPTQSLQLDYDRLLRLHAPARIQIQAMSTSDRTIKIQISRDYLEQFQIAHLLPEPEQAISSTDSYIYCFPTFHAYQLISVTIDLQPEQIGWVNGTIALDAESALQFRQWIYP